MTVHSLSDLEQLWTANGGNPTYAPFAAAIALAESGGNDQSVSPSNDWGIWQINGGGQAMLDPNANAKRAIAMSSNGTNWTPWCTAFAHPVGQCGHGGPSYLAAGSPVWAHLPAGATLPPNAPPGAGGTGGNPGVAGVPGTQTASSSATSAGIAGGGGCRILLPTTSLGPVHLGGWCLDGPVGIAAIAAGATVMLVGTVVLLSRFQGTRQIAGAALTAVPGGGAVAMGARAAGANVGRSGSRSRPGPSRNSSSSGSKTAAKPRESLDDDDLQALDANLAASRPDRAARRRQVERANTARRRASGPRGFPGDKPSDFAA